MLDMLKDGNTVHSDKSNMFIQQRGGIIYALQLRLNEDKTKVIVTVSTRPASDPTNDRLRLSGHVELTPEDAVLLGVDATVLAAQARTAPATATQDRPVEADGAAAQISA